jgi:hypothetical protein
MTEQDHRQPFMSSWRVEGIRAAHAERVADEEFAAVISEPMSETPAEEITAAMLVEAVGIADAYEAEVDHSERLLTLMQEAQAGRAYAALGYPSHAAYVVDRFAGALNRLPVWRRRQVVHELTVTGLPGRAIGQLTGTSNATVSRDLAATVTDETDDLPEKVNGLDGVERTRRKADESEESADDADEPDADDSEPEEPPLKEPNLDHPGKSMERDRRRNQANAARLQQHAPDLHQLWVQGDVDWPAVKAQYQYRMTLAETVRDLTWLARADYLDLPVVLAGMRLADLRRYVAEIMTFLQTVQELILSAEPPEGPDSQDDR